MKIREIDTTKNKQDDNTARRVQAVIRSLGSERDQYEVRVKANNEIVVTKKKPLEKPPQ